MVEVRHLKLVEAVNRLGTLKQAAEELHLTQSALSHQLRQLENILSTPIFYRTPQKLLLTPSGKEFWETAKEILEKINQLESRIAENKQVSMQGYIHGYSEVETQRLYDQANAISAFLHGDSHWPEGSLILEVGCGVGAQTQIIAPQNPSCHFTGVDISEKSLNAAKNLLAKKGIENIELLKADFHYLPFSDKSFDHVFLCFVLEHVESPHLLLEELKRVLKPGGSITAIEGDHGSTYFHPENAAARKTIQAQVLLQGQKGGNANIGRALFPLLFETGFEDIEVTPRQVYVDDSKPHLVEGFILNTFTAMIKGIAEEAIAQKLVQKEEFRRGIQALEKTASGGGTFCYTFFKGRAVKR